MVKDGAGNEFTDVLNCQMNEPGRVYKNMFNKNPCQWPQKCINTRKVQYTYIRVRTGVQYCNKQLTGGGT